jgi:hypothetical protein
LHKSDTEKWDRIFQDTKNKINERFSKKTLSLEPVPIPSEFQVKPISKEEYSTLSSKVGYGFKLGPMSNDCIPAKKNDNT